MLSPTHPLIPQSLGPAPRLGAGTILLWAAGLGPKTLLKAVRQLRELRQLGPTLAGSFAVGAVLFPHRTAVCDETSARTYRQLDRRGRGIARVLAAYGFRPDATVAVLGRNSVALVEAVLGISYLGANALLLDPSLPPAQIREILQREKPCLVFCDADLGHRLLRAPHPLFVVPLQRADSQDGQVTLEELIAGGGPGLVPPQRPGQLLVLGSDLTARAKRSHGSPVSGRGPAASVIMRRRLRYAETLVLASPLSQAWGLELLQLSAVVTGTVVLRGQADPETVLRALAETGAGALATVPAVLERLARSPESVRGRYDLSRLRLVASCGDPLPADLTNRITAVFGRTLCHIEGSARASWTTLVPQEAPARAWDSAAPSPAATRIGVLDDNGYPVAPGTVGRIVAGNAHLPDGTRHDSSDVDELLFTGNLGYLDATGRLRVVTPADGVPAHGAQAIHPAVVEDVIRTLPGVREVAMTSILDPLRGQRLVAYVVAEPGAQLTATRIRRHILRHLTPFMAPDHVAFVCRLPRTATGSIMRPLGLPRMRPAPEAPQDRSPSA